MYVRVCTLFVSSSQFNKLQSVAERRGWTKFTVMQNHYNALYREEEREMIPYCLDSGVALTPYSPLASGLLARHPAAAAGATPTDASATDSAPSQREQTDKVQRAKYYKDGDADVITAVQGVAKDRGVPPAQVALAWLWSKAGVAAPIIGATKAHHISDAVAALQIRLTDDETKRIEEHYRPHEITGHA
jgi:aryl-alcohol dehydrogenase-like predicted oxidoreductase